ncbi:hypothetical protein HGO21_16935 [Acinetobacter sp. CUI P1]|nr:hypothetical protein [Acinetobacter sp. CUI P1]
MTTVYIVTSGSYSEYRIKRVFLDENKAKMYKETIRDSQIEEWEADDNKELDLFRTVTVTLEYTKEGFRRIEKHLETFTVLDTDKDGTENSIYFNALTSMVNPREYLSITRIIPNDSENKEIEQRYERVIDDLYAQIHSLIDVEGWSSDMVVEWLADKGRWNDIRKGY